MTVRPVPEPPSVRESLRQIWERLRPDFTTPENRRRALLYGLGPFVLLADLNRSRLQPGDPGWSRVFRTGICAALAMAGNVGLALMMFNIGYDLWIGRQDRTLVVGMLLAALFATVPLFIAARLTAPGPDTMPVFTIKGKDQFAPEIVQKYRETCEAHGLYDQAEHVRRAHNEIVRWQDLHPDAVHLPDHPHVPAVPR